jgi:hypothetical protein
MEPTAHQIRLTSEDVIADLLENAHLARRNRDLLDYTEFAARRFDLLGQKAIYAKYIADLYFQAQSQTSDPKGARGFLRGVTGGRDSLVQNMRGQTLVLREMYRKLWLGENLPYYMDDILARYDEESGRWEEIADRINRSERNLSRHALPPLIEDSEPAAK